MNYNVVRAYNPSAEATFKAFQQLSIANIVALAGGQNGTYPNALLSTQITPSLIHRKIWVWFWSVSATWNAEIDLVFTLGNVEKYRQKIMRYGTSGQDRFVFCWNAWATGVPLTNEAMQVFVSTTAYVATPLRLNIAADEVHLEVVTMGGSSPLFNAGLHVVSQAGI